MIAETIMPLQDRRDSGMRNGIEGVYGTGKRKYSLGRIMSKLRATSETTIAVIILVMNLEKRLRDILSIFCTAIFLFTDRRFLLLSGCLTFSGSPNY